MNDSNPVVTFDLARDALIDMAVSAIRLLPNLVIGIVIVLIAIVVAGRVKRIVGRAVRRAEMSTGSGIVIGRLARWTVVLFGVFLAMIVVLPDFTPSSLIGALGVTSIAIGFAFKDILENLLAGVLMLISEPFRIGDLIEVDGYEGTVETIETRATQLRTPDGRRVTMPNATVFTNAVVISTAFEARRSEYDIGIGYSEDVERVKALILDVLGRIDGLNASPAPECYLWELGDSAVMLRMRWWSDPTNREVAEARDLVLTEVKKALDAEGIEIPFPIRTVHLFDRSSTHPMDSDG